MLLTDAIRCTAKKMIVHCSALQTAYKLGKITFSVRNTLQYKLIEFHENYTFFVNNFIVYKPILSWKLFPNCAIYQHAQ